MHGKNESGVALIAALLVMALMSALVVGFVAMVVSDQRAGFANRDQTQAYSAAHAGLEQLTSDLGELFATNYAPTGVQINALATTPPALPGVTFVSPGGGPGYTIAFTPDVNGNPATELTPRSITTGPFQGFLGLVTPYTVTVTARTAGGSEVRMRREMQTVAIPVFQFGIFSENDLSFFAGPDFNFGGRVHTNSHLFLAEQSGILTLADRVTVVGEVIRTHLANNVPVTVSGHTGSVRVARAPNVYRDLKYAGPNESSVNIAGSASVPPTIPLTPPNTANEPIWTNLSVGTYNSYIRNGRTGARRLDLPLVQMGARPVDLVRRPLINSNEDVANAPVFGQRYFGMASLRILLSDTAADILNLPTVTAQQPVDLTDITASGYVVDAAHPPIARSSGINPQLTPVDTSLIDGFIKVEKQDRNGNWTDVTLEILNLGIAGRNISNGILHTPDTNICTPFEPNPDAVIRLQRIRDVPSTSVAPLTNAKKCGVGAGGFTQVATDYWPNVLYDAREGVRRDAEPTGQNNPYLGGLMHYVELDVNNLRRWLQGQIGANGANAQDLTGYVVYFSDRRLNRTAPVALGGLETGEFGWEDFINTDAISTPNGVLDPGEDMNGNGLLETYGNAPTVVAGSQNPLGATARVWTAVSRDIARTNRAIFFRRALKIVNGGRGNLPANGLQGLMVASENPVYVQGNYNAPNAAGNAFGPTGDGHVSAAIIADALTFLSNAWNDIVSFNVPHDAAQRNATMTWYRTAIIAGKGLTFPHPGSGVGGAAAGNAGDHTDFGTDGGAHNFIRYIEDWSGQTLNYRGSILSFFTSRQAVGTYKCCDNVYSPPTRGYNFDVEFLTPSLLPPRTPMFRDVNTLTFRQVLRPTQ
jgi:hypothetical protein